MDSEEDNGEPEVAPPPLSWRIRLCYALGHMLNDLSAAMWFSYLIVYLQFVVGCSTDLAGLILLVGQVTDALATPLIGYVCDNRVGRHLGRKYGRRKSLHLIGTICVVVSFPLIFIKIPGTTALIVGVILTMVVIFQIGWAATQVGHMALIPTLTPLNSERDMLAVLRYISDVISDVCVYGITWLVLIMGAPVEGKNGTIQPTDAPKFMVIALILTALGIICSIIFHIGIKDKPDITETSSGYSTKRKSSCKLHVTISWKQWFRNIHFYQVGLIYASTRLFQNLSSVFIPLYLQDSLQANQDFVAKIPLVMNISGFASSCLLPYTYRLCGKKFTFFIGTILGVSSCVWILYGEGPEYCSGGIYGVACLLGAADSVLVICATSFIPDLIGSSEDSGAFVYGFMSFLDKLATGLGIMAVQRIYSVAYFQYALYYRGVLAYGVGGTALFSFAILLTLLHVRLGQQKESNSGGEWLSRSVETPFFTQSIQSQEERDPLLPHHVKDQPDGIGEIKMWQDDG